MNLKRFFGFKKFAKCGVILLKVLKNRRCAIYPKKAHIQNKKHQELEILEPGHAQ